MQAQILELMKDLQREFDSAIILITHDLGVVAETCDKVVVMYGGQAVEQGSINEIFYEPEMPYAWGLLRLHAADGPDCARRGSSPSRARRRH